MAMKFLNKLFNKVIFSDAPELNATAYDMGEAMCKVTFQDDVVNRLRTATGSVGSLAIFVGCEVSISIAKTSNIISEYQNRILRNGFIGGTLTLYDDTNREFVFYDVSLNQKEIPSMNGTEPAVEFIIQGNLEVNKEALNAVGL